jgi:hypothetical protein
VKERLVEEVKQIKMGDVRDFTNFMGAVIDKRAFDKHTEYLRLAHETAKVVTGGESDGKKGWFVKPTIVQVDDPKHRMMREEIFGPIVTAYVYDAKKWDDVLPSSTARAPTRSRGRCSRATGRDRRGEHGASLCGRELLRQRQAHRRRGQPAALRRRPGERHQRQGRFGSQPAPVGFPADDQGELRAPGDWRYPFLG